MATKRRDEESSDEMNEANSNDLLFGIDDVPPWYTCIGLGFQHYLTMLGGNIAIPLILADPLCIQDNTLAKAELISTIFFVGGIATLIQTIIGVRLPVVEGGSYAFLVPTFALLSTPQFRCDPANQTSDGWHPAMRQIQGSIMVASALQIVVGVTGMIGFLLTYIGPLTIAPTVTVTGLALFGTAADDFAGIHWGISAMTMGLIIIFSQHLRNVRVPFPAYRKGSGFGISWTYVFKLYPIFMAMCTCWGFCGILTATNVFPTSPEVYGYGARTDLRLDVLREAAWFRVPYPGQWGLPTVSISGVLAMISVILVSIVGAIGDFYACARLCGAPPPPTHAINRGIAVDGVVSLFGGAWGCGCGMAIYSENIAAIGITKMGCRRIIQAGAAIAILLAVIGKFGALVTTIPDPVIGGMFCVTFGMISAVGVSTLQYVDLNSTRNLLIMGFATFMGLAVPEWVSKNSELINTGITELDQVILVLLQTGMFIACLLGFLLDNTIPGTRKERGLIEWNEICADFSEDTETEAGVESKVSENMQSLYEFPWPTPKCCVNTFWEKMMMCIPICPKYSKKVKSEKGPEPKTYCNHVAQSTSL